MRFIRPTIPPPEEWLPYLSEAYRQRVFTNFGPLATRLERQLLHQYGNGQRGAVLTANCTVGLTAALLALKVTGRVVVPSFTFAATAQAVLQAQCEPVFCDVNIDSWEMDPESLATILRTGSVSAVLYVRAFGFCRDLKLIEQLTQDFGVPLVIDSAAALGGQLPNGDWVGNQGDMEIFSLHATKVFGLGEGGLILTRPQHEDSLRRVVNFGLHQGDVISPGCNGKFSEFHAAVGLALVEKIAGFIDRRRVVARRYAEAFVDLPAALVGPGVGKPAWQSFPMLFPSEIDVAGLMDSVYRAGIELRRYYWPALHQTTLFRAFAQGSLKRAEYLARGMLCIPVYSDMTDEEQERVIEIVRGAVAVRTAVLRAA